MASQAKHKLQALWDSMEPRWRSIVADHLDLKEYFSHKDLVYLPTIEDLECREHQFREMMPISCFPRLMSLDISDSKFKKFSRLSFRHDSLEELNAMNCDLSQVKTFEYLPSLRLLDVSYSRLNTYSLFSLELIDGLEELYCNGCGITNIDVFLPLENLRVLSVLFNPIPEEDILFFKSLYPQCKVLY